MKNIAVHMLIVALLSSGLACLCTDNAIAAASDGHDGHAAHTKAVPDDKIDCCDDCDDAVVAHAVELPVAIDLRFFGQDSDELSALPVAIDVEWHATGPPPPGAPAPNSPLLKDSPVDRHERMLE